MVVRSNDSQSRVFRVAESVDAETWASARKLLFLAPNHSDSRVEVYSAEVSIHPGIDKSVIGTSGDDRAIREKTVASPASVDFDEGGWQDVASDEFGWQDVERETDGVEALRSNSVHIHALKTSKDISDYANGTTGHRAFFIRQSYSWGPLSITADLFGKLMLQTRFSTRLKSFIMYMGSRVREVELAPPALQILRLSASLDDSQGGLECIYGLRFMDRNGRGNSERPSRGWSLRQSTIACRYAPKSEGIAWLFVTISHSMQKSLDSIVIDDGYFWGSNPAEVHFLLVESAVSSWRHYLIDLGEEIDSQYAQILGMSPNDEGPIDLNRSGMHQELLMLDEKLLNSLLAAGATADTVNALTSSCDLYAKVAQAQNLCGTGMARASFDGQQRHIRRVIAQIENFRCKLAGMTEVLSSFLDLNSGLSLQNLAKASAKENEEMRKLSERMHTLAEKSTQDAAAVKVLTILTLIYLPVTVVSNFFSTSFVSTTGGSDGAGSIIVSSDWWILVAVSIPLTLITIYVWMVWTRIQANGRPWSWFTFSILAFKLRQNRETNGHGNEKKGTDITNMSTYCAATEAQSQDQIMQRRFSDIC